ncbi:MAG TPA: hypothetical protein VN608_05240 [Clostridia bacterium]|nr:hypothetical protein [Clostridia bacterium]
MKSMKRITALALAMMLLLSFGSFAQAAADNNAVKITTVSNTSSYTVESGIANVLVKIEMDPAAVTPMYFVVTNIQMENSGGLMALANKDTIDAQETANGKIEIPAGGYTTFLVPVTVPSGSVSGTANMKLTLAFYTNEADPVGTPTAGTYDEYVVGTNVALNADSVTNKKPLTFTVPSTDNGSGDGTTTSAFRLSPVDANGNKVSAPSGNYGDKVTIRIPILAKTSASNITIAPVLTTSLDTFPFVISNVDYTLNYPNGVSAGQVLEFQYTFTLSKKVTAGVKQIDFIVNADGSWGANNTSFSDKISIFLTVNKGASVTDGTGTPPAVSTPKLIVESYTFSTDKVYAGETFDVTFVLRNTSETENIQNLQIRIADDTNTILPAASGSNTLYIAKIGKGETYTETISLQTTPGAEAKAYTLGVEMDYEAASTKTAYKASESISVPVLQKIRVKADEPVIYDEAWMGSPFSMYLAFYNLGKSTVYNCTVTVEGDGLAMEVGYFGGNVSSGAAMNADFTVIPSVAGDISANVVISYEDVYGEQYELKMPFNIYVNDMGGGEIIDGGMEPLPFPDDGGMVDGGMNGGMQPGLPVWVWIVIGVAVLAGGAVLVILLKRRRNKELEEL